MRKLHHQQEKERSSTQKCRVGLCPQQIQLLNLKDAKFKVVFIKIYKEDLEQWERRDYQTWPARFKTEQTRNFGN